jgi:uncharacterized protein (TIGR02271 family)
MATQSPAVPLYSEELSVSRQQITGDTVQVSVITHEGEGIVDEMLNHEHRVPVGRPVDAIPPVRQEGETTILPVVEEIIVVERRLILREEVRIKRRHVSERHQEALVLRKQEAVITRMDPHSGSERQEK